MIYQQSSSISLFQHQGFTILSNLIVVQIDQKDRGPNGPQLAIFMSDTAPQELPITGSYCTLPSLSDVWSRLTSAVISFGPLRGSNPVLHLQPVDCQLQTWDPEEFLVDSLLNDLICNPSRRSETLD